MVKKETKRFLLGSVALLSLVVAGCSTEKKDSKTKQVTTAKASTEETTQVTTQATAQDVTNYKTDGTQPSKTFNWEATVAPLKNFEKEYIDYKGNRVKEKSYTLANAVLTLQDTKSKITEPKVLEALKLLDAVYIDQGNIGEVLKAAGVSSQKELYTKIWNDFMISFLTSARPEFTNDATYEYAGITYAIKDYGPMKLKVDVNSLGQAGAYTLESYGVEGDTVYIKYRAPIKDEGVENLLIKHQTNNQAFFDALKELSQEIVKTDYSKNLLLRFLYSLGSLEFKGDGSFGTKGDKEYSASSSYIVAITVDDNGNKTIDMDNLVALLQIHAKTAYEANKARFKSTR